MAQKQGKTAASPERAQDVSDGCSPSKKKHKAKSPVGAKSSQQKAPIPMSQKKEMAHLLFTRDNLSQKEIAAKVGVTEKTISLWVAAGEWVELKKSISLTRDQLLRSMHDQLLELNATIRKREEGLRFPTNDEALVQQKLSRSIADLEKEVGIQDHIQTFKEFGHWMPKDDIQLRQTIMHLFDAFIMFKVRKK